MYLSRLPAMNQKMITCMRQLLSHTLLNRISNDAVSTLSYRRFCTISPFVVQEIVKKVKPYGKLVIDVPCNVEIKPTDPHEYPNMDTLRVTLSSSKNNSVKQTTEFLLANMEENQCEITTSDKEQMYCPSDMQCFVELPIQYDVDARTVGHAGIKIFNMVSDNIRVGTELGNIIAGKLQANRIKIVSNQGGSIDLRHSLQGNIEIKTAMDGSIKAEKCLGTSLEITTENGDVTVGSNYCEKATFSTVNGDLRLNNLHMDANVCILGSGALKVSCLDGSLQAKLGEGETKVQIVRLSGESHMISKGSVHLVVPKENDVQLNLKGSNLLLDESLSDCKVLHSNGQQVLGTNGKIPLNVETTGDIRVTVASWAETLQIGNFMK